MAAIKGHPAVVEALQFLAPSDLLRSSVVLGELETGVINCAWPARNRLQLLALVDQLELVPVDRAVALGYAKNRATLERQGTPIAANDLWIATNGLWIAAQEQALNRERRSWGLECLALVNWLR